jgi:hypothetical protein
MGETAPRISNYYGERAHEGDPIIDPALPPLSRTGAALVHVLAE